MSRITVFAIALGAFAALPVVRAQDNPLPRSAQPVPGIVRDGGVFQLSTGTWTRKASSASLGADTIYDNTCSSGYVGFLSGDTYVDEGRLPGPNSGGCATSYRVDGFQISYCTDRPVPGPFEIGFYDSYVACATVIGATPSGAFSLSGLPGSSGGAISCWIVTIDLGAPPGGSALSFSMEAEAAPSGLFGWSFGSSAPPAEQTGTGPVIAGDPNVCGGFDGTRWDSVVNYGEQGTGFGSLNQFRIEGGPTAPGCYWYGGTPFASYHLELYADACPTVPAGEDFCNGDGSSTACPCGNASNPGQNGGCLNSLGQAGRLRAEGVPSLAHDTLNLFSAGIPPNGPQLFFQGTSRRNGGMGQVLGDGLFCAGGTMTRLGVIPGDQTGSATLPSGGAQAVSILGGVTSPGVRTYQGWYRNAASFCTGATFNLTNGWEVTWAP